MGCHVAKQPQKEQPKKNSNFGLGIPDFIPAEVEPNPIHEDHGPT